MFLLYQVQKLRISGGWDLQDETREDMDWSLLELGDGWWGFIILFFLLLIVGKFFCNKL
jgi:hypothetical protein